MGNDRKEYHKQWYQKNKEKEREKQKQYRKENREKLLEHCKKYRITNKNKIKTYLKYYFNETIIGRAVMLRNGYIAEDRKKGRIGNELPKDYVSISDVVRLITKKCSYFDVCHTYGWRKIGLNRINNSLPHILSNVEPCCADCNNRLNDEERSIPIEQYDLITDETIKIWKNAGEAARAIGGSQGNIWSCCNGLRQSHKGSGWRFYDKIKG